MFIGDHYLTVLQKHSKNIFADIKSVPRQVSFTSEESEAMKKC